MMRQIEGLLAMQPVGLGQRRALPSCVAQEIERRGQRNQRPLQQPGQQRRLDVSHFQAGDRSGFLQMFLHFPAIVFIAEIWAAQNSDVVEGGEAGADIPADSRLRPPGRRKRERRQKHAAANQSSPPAAMPPIDGNFAADGARRQGNGDGVPAPPAPPGPGAYGLSNRLITGLDGASVGFCSVQSSGVGRGSKPSSVAC